MNLSSDYRYIQQLKRMNTYASTQGVQIGQDDLEQDELFEDMLAKAFASGGIVSSEEILADLDGTPTFRYTGLPADERNNGAYESSSSDTSAGSSAYSRGVIMEKIERIAKTYGVDAKLVREVVRAESNFNPQAVSRAGAKGLMQLMDGTARGLQVKNSFDPDQNLNGGTKYLRNLLQKYDGNVKVALAAYNAGPGRIDRLGIDTDKELESKAALLPKETQRYVDKITSRLHS